MEAGGRDAEFYSQFALPLPARMTAILLGAAQADYEEMAYLADRMMYLSWTVSSPETQADIRERVRAWFDRHIDARLAALEAAGIADPGPEHLGKVVPDDLVSDVICGKVEGRRISRLEMHQMLQVMLVGGIETSAHLITNLVWRLLQDRARWEAVAADPDRLIPVAIEESLRFDPPGLGLWRTTVREFELHGEVIPAQAKVQMSYGSANRDPRVFSDPDAFRLDRAMSEMRRHLTFGFGPHMCVGQHLSRLEANLALRAFFQRLPGLRLAGETERVENFGFWGRGRMPVAW
jgi:cytochrome P450